LILAMTVLLPVGNSHCTRVRFTVIVSCSDELAIRAGLRGGNEVNCPARFKGAPRDEMYLF